MDGDGETSLPSAVGADLPVGTHDVHAVFTPTDDGTYAPSTDAATPTIDKAATTTTVSVTGTEIRNTVTRTTDGAGAPGGTVELFVDGESVGTAAPGAALTHQVAAGDVRNVSAVYSGDASFLGSSDSTARKDPALTATRSSATGRRHGWYRSPVTVTVHCEATSAALTGDCPAPVTLTRSAGGQSVTRTVMAEDGGVTTLTVGGIDLDRGAPVVRVTGVRAGATYLAGGPQGACRIVR